jgi:hypothetical protein
MKTLFIFVLLVLSNQVFAGCEGTILKGVHTASILLEAEEGALEEANDSCYPGNAQMLDMQCESFKENDKQLYRCSQEASCTMCGEELTRKYEALD